MSNRRIQRMIQDRPVVGRGDHDALRADLFQEGQERVPVGHSAGPQVGGVGSTIAESMELHKLLTSLGAARAAAAMALKGSSSCRLSASIRIIAKRVAVGTLLPSLSASPARLSMMWRRARARPSDVRILE